MGKRNKKARNSAPHAQATPQITPPQTKPPSPPLASSPTDDNFNSQKEIKVADPTVSCDTCAPQVSQKLWQRFYEPIVLLSAYGKSQGVHFKSTDDEEGWSDGNRDPKKQFLDQLAYICDYETGGDTVTAVAVEHGPELKYWIAGNTNKEVKLRQYITGILASLETVFDASEEHILAVQAQITDRVIELCSNRLEFYKRRLHPAAKWCIKQLQREDTEAANSLKIWLTSLCNRSLELRTLSQLCYDARALGRLSAITRKVEETKQRRNSSDGGHYSEARHLIGRLGSHIKAVKVLVEVGRHYPQLFQNVSVQFATADQKFTAPPYRSKTSINEIINRMVSSNEPVLREFYQKEIGHLDKTFGLELQKRIDETYKDPKFRLRVHAEIILHDLFARENLQFLDGARYIGVSKPSCFLCYRYLQAHRIRVQTSGCSNNLYLQWQPPYVYDESLLGEQEAVLIKMNQEIRKFVLDTIVPNYQGHRSHPDSTTGIETLVSVRHARSESRFHGLPTQTMPLETLTNSDVSLKRSFDSESSDAVGENPSHLKREKYVDSSDESGVSLFA
ncbi:hypothetical protein TWF506_008040 [Arthrobotrys conoides]|uniref:Uncharacterized protein n=1 Tax=Arthrobotrys conoides TaxID=74498 RepID=A0AAN8RXV8_9PEZI